MVTTTNRLAISLATVVAIVGCGTAVDDTQPGSCSLDCSNRVPAPHNSDVRDGGGELTQITMLTTEDNVLSCVGVGNAGDSFEGAGPILVRALITSPQVRPRDPTAPIGDDNYFERVNLPLAGIAFEPLVAAPQNLAPDRTTSEFLATDADNNQVVTPFRFRGVVTPSSEWCSDSCGVMTYEVWPLCVNGLEISTTLNFISGGIRAADPMSLQAEGT